MRNSAITSFQKFYLMITLPPLLSHKTKSWKTMEPALSNLNQILNYPPAWQHHWRRAGIEPTTSASDEQKPPSLDSLLASVSTMAPIIKWFYLRRSCIYVYRKYGHSHHLSINQSSIHSPFCFMRQFNRCCRNFVFVIIKSMKKRQFKNFKNNCMNNFIIITSDYNNYFVITNISSL